MDIFNTLFLILSDEISATNTGRPPASVTALQHSISSLLSVLHALLAGGPPLPITKICSFLFFNSICYYPYLIKPGGYRHSVSNTDIQLNEIRQIQLFCWELVKTITVPTGQ